MGDYMFYFETEEELINFIDNLPENIKFTDLFLISWEMNQNVFSNFCNKYENIILKNILNFNSNFSIYNTFNLMILLHTLPFFDNNFVKQNEYEIENFISSNLNTLDPEIFLTSWFLSLSSLLKDLLKCSKTHSFIYEFLNKHLEFIAMILTNKKLEVLKKEKILDTYIELIKDVFRIENASINDLILKNGGYSNVLIIKDKVIKSGKKITKKIPYHRRLLQPIIRQVIPSINNNADFDFIEVYERTLPFKEGGVSCYDVFKEMLDDGILWSDPKDDNLGILIKPNTAFRENMNDDKPFFIDGEVVNIFGDGKKEILEKGEVVVIDLDFVYDVRKDINKDIIMGDLKKDPNIEGSYISDKYKKYNIKFGNFIGDYLDRYIDEIKDELKNIKK